MSALFIQAHNLSQAWLQAMRELDRQPEHRAIHTMVCIADPTTEDPGIRDSIELLLADKEQYSVDTVANTVFPAALAADCGSHEELVRRYLALYERLRQFRDNRLGTYFHRLIAYPGPDGPVDQIARALRLLGQGSVGQFTRYEALLESPTTPQPSPDEPTPVGEQENVDIPLAPIYVPGKDNTPGTFPCMSHCSFQLDSQGRLHALAYYRSHSMVQRAYGNYLGLGRLLAYVAAEAGLATGQLTVVAGQAKIEMALRNVGLLLSQPDTLPGMAI